MSMFWTVCVRVDILSGVFVRAHMYIFKNAHVDEFKWVMHACSYVYLSVCRCMYLVIRVTTIANLRPARIHLPRNIKLRLRVFHRTRINMYLRLRILVVSDACRDVRCVCPQRHGDATTVTETDWPGHLGVKLLATPAPPELVSNRGLKKSTRAKS